MPGSPARLVISGPTRLYATNNETPLPRRAAGRLADGIGGVDFGEVASAIATHAVTYLDRCVSSRGPHDDLAAAVDFAEYRFGTAVAGSPQGFAGMGATMTALLLDGGVTVLAHVGDSRGYPAPRRPAGAAHPRPHVRADARQRGRSVARGGRAPPAAARHREGPAGRRGHVTADLLVSAARPATAGSFAATG